MQASNSNYSTKRYQVNVLRIVLLAPTNKGHCQAFCVHECTSVSTKGRRFTIAMNDNFPKLLVALWYGSLPQNIARCQDGSVWGTNYELTMFYCVTM